MGVKEFRTPNLVVVPKHRDVVVLEYVYKCDVSFLLFSRRESSVVFFLIEKVHFKSFRIDKYLYH